jgi:hypothetical protein
MMTLSNIPRAMMTEVNGKPIDKSIAIAPRIDILAKSRPNCKARVGAIFPEGIGRCLVRSIIASISRSKYDVSTSEPAEPRITDPTTNATRIGETLIPPAAIIAPNAVNTKRYQILGFVSS